MRAATPGMEVLTERLGEVLEEQIQHLERRRRQFKELADVIVRRDERALETMLEEIECALATQEALDARLEATRSAIADAMLRRPEAVTLGAVVEALSEPVRSRMAARRRQLIETVDALSRQHLHTSMLLMECVRINRLMLEAVFPHSRGVTTYVPGGQDRWRPETGLIDAER